MAINDKTQSPADLLAADAQSGIKDLQASADKDLIKVAGCLLYTSPSPRDP